MRKVSPAIHLVAAFKGAMSQFFYICRILALAVCFALMPACAFAVEADGTLQIVARYTAGGPLRHTYMAMGSTVAFIEGQEAKVEADEIFYDDRTHMVEARGHVRVTRFDKLTTLTEELQKALKFKVDSVDYLITDVHTEISVRGPKMITLAPEDVAR